MQLFEHLYDFKYKKFHDFKCICALYDISNSAFLKYHALRSSNSPNIKSHIEVDLCYTAPTYYFNKSIKHNTMLTRLAHIIKTKGATRK